MAQLFLSLRPRSIVAAFLAGLAALTLSGCTFVHGHQSTFFTEGPVAEEQMKLWMLTIWVTLFIFIAVGGVLAYATWRFIARKDDKDDGEHPEQTHGNPLIEMGLIVVSVLLLVIIAVPTLRVLWYSEDLPPGEDVLEVNATGYQWWFGFHYPAENITTGNELVIPAGRVVQVHLRTSDVIHSFWIPKLAGKKDMIPNRANWMWIKADRPGYFWGQCAEFCGESHANMKFRVVALDPAEYELWVQRHQQPARNAGDPLPPLFPEESARMQTAGLPTPMQVHDHRSDAPFQYWRAKQELRGEEDLELIARGRLLFQQKACLGCHRVDGHEGAGVSGPDLTRIGTRTSLAAGMLDNTPENLFRWIQRPDEIKPGNLMWKGYPKDENGHVQVFSDDEVNALVAYLNSLK
jgi:cytochrome c oxidase subunit II